MNPRLASAGLLLLCASAPSPALPAPQTCTIPAAPTNCNTPVPAGAYGNLNWTSGGSPYCVNGNITVSNLMIGPGVCVRVGNGSSITILTSINANGTAAQPITFTQRNSGTPWQGLILNALPPGSNLTWCTVEYSNNSGIRVTNCLPALDHCTISNNTAPGSGGGITASVATGDLVLTACTLSGNTSSGGGGGIYASFGSGDLVLDDCTIIGNQSTSHGGGIRATMSSGTLRPSRCLIYDNTANYPIAVSSTVGGGVYITGNSLFRDCECCNNTSYSAIACNFCGANAYSGGIHTDTGSCVLENCTVRDNSSRCIYYWGSFSSGYSFGGGVSLWGGSLSVTNSIVAGNYVASPNGSYSGGIYVNAGTATITNSTIARNNIEGLYVNGGTTTVLDSILFYNNGGGSQIVGSPVVTYSDVQGGTPFPGLGNITFSPAFAGTGTSNYDLRLLSGSSCTDAGDPAGPNDVCMPPSLGTVRNDMGAFGGPLACNWVNTNAVGGAVSYCTATTNSSGNVASIGWCGSTSISANNLALYVRGCPSSVHGLFYYGYTQQQVILGNGYRCIANVLRRLQNIQTDATGEVSYQVPLPTLSIAPGDNLDFQFWFRDPTAMPSTSNLSDALEVFFQP